MSKLPDPTMVVYRSHLGRIRHEAAKSNENLIDAICEMEQEDPFPVEAIRFGIRKLRVSRALLRCPENQEDA